MKNQQDEVANEARRLVRKSLHCSLATVGRENGAPYVSFANLATDSSGLPIILVSELAWHTQNLLKDPRASVLVADPPSTGDAMTGFRVTVMGRFVRSTDLAVRRRYLAKHPPSAGYADFGDFSFWRMEADQIHSIAGFGRIVTLAATDVFRDAGEIAELEESAIEHLNADHADALAHYASSLGAREPDQWKAAAIDCDGLDLTNGDRCIRLPFPSPVFDAASLRRQLGQMRRT
jgi:putative heme iron utilization protein